MVGAPLYTVASDALDQPQAAAVSARVGGVDWGWMCGWEFSPSHTLLICSAGQAGILAMGS